MRFFLANFQLEKYYKKSIKNETELQKYRTKKRYLAWRLKDIRKLSEAAAVEAVLNYGDWNDVQKIIKILGAQKVAQIFFKESSKPRQNYQPKTKHFFSLYLKKYKTID